MMKVSFLKRLLRSIKCLTHLSSFWGRLLPLPSPSHHLGLFPQFSLQGSMPQTVKEKHNLYKPVVQRSYKSISKALKAHLLFSFSELKQVIWLSSSYRKKVYFEREITSSFLMWQKQAK